MNQTFPFSFDSRAIKQPAKGGEKGQMETRIKQVWGRGGNWLDGRTVPHRFHLRKHSVPRDSTDQLRLNPGKSGQNRATTPSAKAMNFKCFSLIPLTKIPLTFRFLWKKKKQKLPNEPISIFNLSLSINALR
jgi:hypothetical protein